MAHSRATTPAKTTDPGTECSRSLMWREPERNLERRQAPHDARSQGTGLTHTKTSESVMNLKGPSTPTLVRKYIASSERAEGPRCTGRHRARGWWRVWRHWRVAHPAVAVAVGVRDGISLS